MSAELWALRHFEGLSFGQIAKRTGLTKNTVMSRLAKMRPEDAPPRPSAPPPPPLEPTRPAASPGLLRLAAFDPLARALVEGRTLSTQEQSNV